MKPTHVKPVATSLFSLSILLAGQLQATPTGLNNIPTADTVPHRTVAVHSFSSFGEGANQFAANGPGEHSHWMGFKTGWELPWANLEWGLDSPVITGPSGPLFFQTKANFSPWEDGLFALGVAGIAMTDTDRAGDPFTYGILSQDLGLLRAHAGYGVQTGGNSWLLGVDRTWSVFERDFNLNLDLVQAADESMWLPAAGLKYHLTEHLVFEWWTNFPERGKPSHIAKLNFVFTY